MTREPLLAAAFALLLACSPVEARDMVPASDADLRSVVASSAAILAASLSCEGGLCRSAQCELAGTVADRLGEVEQLLQIVEPWLDDARHAALEHYTTLVRNLAAQADRQAELEFWMGYQGAFIAAGKILLDIASIADALQGISAFLSQDPSQITRWGDILRRAEEMDGYFELASNTLSALDTVVAQFDSRGVPAPPSFKQTLEAKNVASEAKTGLLRLLDALRLANAGQLAGDHLLRAAGRQQALLAMRNLAQVVGKLGIAFAESQRQQMQDELNELAANQLQELATIHFAYQGYQRLAARSEALLAALDALSGYDARLAPCLVDCPALLDPPLPRNDFQTYGEALPYHNARLAELAGELRQLATRFYNDRSAYVTLAVERSLYHPGQRVSVSYEAPHCLTDGGFLRLSDVSGLRLELKPTERTVPGYAHFTAPSALGSYRIAFIPYGSGEIRAETGFSVIDPTALLEQSLDLNPGLFFPAPSDWQPLPNAENRLLWNEECQAIDCDCYSISAGVLTSGWADACFKREEEMIRMCLAGGALDGPCDPVAQGPNAQPR